MLYNKIKKAQKIEEEERILNLNLANSIKAIITTTSLYLHQFT